MLKALKNLRSLIGELFGDNVPESAAWDRIPPDQMTPRERLIRRSSLIMFWGRACKCHRRLCHDSRRRARRHS